MLSRLASKPWETNLCMWTKTKELFLATLATAWIVLEPIHTILYAVFALVLLDFLTGIYRSTFVKKEPFTSRRMRETVVKIVPYLFVLLAGFCVDYVAGVEALFFTRAFALLVMATELQSLGENTGFDLVQILRDKLKPPAPKE